MDWPKIRHENKASRAWASWAGLIVRHRWWAAGVACTILILLIIPLFGIKIGQAQTDSLASSGPAYEGWQTLQTGGVPSGVISPMEVLNEGADPAAVGSSADQIVANSVDVSGVATAMAPDNDQWRHDTSAISLVIPTEETVDSEGAQVVDRVTTANQSVPGFVGVAGAGAIVLDYIHAVYGSFPLVLGIIALVTFLLLARAFRSIILPAKAVLLNIASVAATFGAVVWFWQDGHGSEAIFGVSATGSVTFWLPVLIFAFLFGLIDGLRGVHPVSDARGVRRHREHEAGGRSGTGSHRTPGHRRSAHLVLCLYGAVVDAGHRHQGIRHGSRRRDFAGRHSGACALVPALVSLLGRWNWWLPPWAARALFVEPHAAIVEEPERETTSA